jgi:Helicase HerA, central domain
MVFLMEIKISDYEKLGSFYLGKDYNMEIKKPGDRLVTYDSKDLVTHGVVLGMTGSGKTGLCLTLLEEAAMDNIPAIIIDPKGDIANLLLTFPGLTGKEFEPWVNEEDAAKKGQTIPEYADQTAAMWKKGLEDWGQPAERIQQFKNKVDINIFTPGSKAGIPVSILSSLAVPPFEIMDDAELLGERIESTASSLLSLVGIDNEVTQTNDSVFLAAIFQHVWSAEQNITLESLIRHIQKPTFDRIGVMDVESFYPQKDRQELAMKFNNLIASPSFASWLEGEPLDIKKMLTAPDGKPRISIFSIAHLGDQERMFFVSLLLNQMLGWMRTQSGTTSLRAILYMDEIYGYLPPSANPPSKRPMMTLLKQSRAFGLGCLLATQNPVDLDYKALSNIGTWFLGRLQTERDKLRVLDGLEGAAGAQNVTFNRAKIEKILSSLGDRVFLMNNVHDDEPSIFHVRWAMSYLCGPLTKSQIKVLMDPKRSAFEQAKSASSTAAVNPMAMSEVATTKNIVVDRPLVSAGVTEKFLPHSGESEGLTYHPHLLRVGEVYFSFKKANVEGANTVRYVNPIVTSGIDWENNVPPPMKTESLSEQPTEGIPYAEIPGFAMNADGYKQVEKDFTEWMYRNERAEIFYCESLDSYSQLAETEGEFRSRLTLAAREVRDAEVANICEDLNKKLHTIQSRLNTAEGQLAKEKAESTSAKMQAGISILGGVLGSLLGGKKGGFNLSALTRGKSAISSATGAFKQGKDVGNAEDKIELIQQEINSLNKQTEEKIAQLSTSFEPAALIITTENLKPTKTDVKTKLIALLWIPYDSEGNPAS